MMRFFMVTYERKKYGQTRPQGRATGAWGKRCAEFT